VNLSRSWNQFWTGLNPIPEAVRTLLGSRFFWFALLLAFASGLGQNVLGGFGTTLGILLAGAIWIGLMPDGWLEPAVALAGIVILRGLFAWLSSTGLAQRIRGLKTCPQCAEEVRIAAKTCRYCQHSF
jgi:Uncharacterised protein family UPF0547